MNVLFFIYEIGKSCNRKFRKMMTKRRNGGMGKRS